MQTTTLDDTETPDTDAPVRLRLNVYRALAAAKGAHTVVAQAALHRITRAHMFRLISGGRCPSLELAMQMAQDLGTTVEVLFERSGRQSPRRAKRDAR